MQSIQWIQWIQLMQLMNAINIMNAMDPINAMNECHKCHESNESNECNEWMNAINLMNPMNAINEWIPWMQWVQWIQWMQRTQWIVTLLLFQTVHTFNSHEWQFILSSYRFASSHRQAGSRAPINQSVVSRGSKGWKEGRHSLHASMPRPHNLPMDLRGWNSS